MNDVDRIIHEPARLKIVALLAGAKEAELTEAVERAVPMAARRRGHVATRVFQALRIVVNDEMNELDLGIEGALGVLAPGGLLAIISYHSGEDRAVKAALHEAFTGGCH